MILNLNLCSLFSALPVGPVPMSCPPTTYYQGPPYMMGGVGSYAPPQMNYTPMPYMTGNYGGEGGVAFRSASATNGVVVDGVVGAGMGFRTMGVGGMRTTGVGGSETSVASGNSNASSQSVESVCAAVTKDDDGEGREFRKGVQLNPGLTDFRIPTIFFCYRRTFVIAKKGNKKN